MNSKNNVIGIVFAAGKGTRMRPLTEITPKPLAEVNKKTLLEHNLDKIVDQVEKVVLVVNYLGKKIENHIGESYKGVPVNYAWQKSPTGGTLDAFRTGVMSDNKNLTKNYLVINSDDLNEDLIYLEFKNRIAQDPLKAYFAAKTIKDKSKLPNFGVFKYDNQGILKEVVEKPAEFISDKVNIGLYYFPNKVINFLQNPNKKASREEYLTDDLINPYIQDNPAELIVSKGYWYPISNLEDLERVNKFLG